MLPTFFVPEGPESGEHYILFLYALGDKPVRRLKKIYPSFTIL